MADLIYAGLWFTPLRRALQAFADVATQSATGEVRVELHHGRAQAIARTSPQSLHRPDLASFDMTGYDATDARGFIRLFGLPLATVAQRGLGAEDGGANGGAGDAAAASRTPARESTRDR